MKRIFIYLFTVLVFTSCEKYLEVTPTNQLAVSTYDDVKALLAGHLKMFTQDNFTLSGTNIPYLDETSYRVFAFYSDDLDVNGYLDNFMGANNRGLFHNSLNWQEATISGILWENYYENIGYYNMLLDELDKIEGVGKDDANIIKGEVKFLRAWSFFKLMQYFAPYKIEKLGIPVNLKSQEVGTYDSQRKSQTEVYQLILSELDEILNYDTAPTSYNIFYDKKVIHALMAQVYHFKGASGAGTESDWGNAITHAKAALEGRVLQGIDNYNPINVEDMVSGLFKNKDNALIVNVRSGYTPNYQNIVAEPAYGMYQRPSVDLYKLYDKEDVRYTAFFCATNWSGTTDSIIAKFYKPDFMYGYYAMNFFQISDLHLIVAESYARQNDMSNATQWLEEFMRHRIPGYTHFTGSDVLQAILDERRKEFCFEYDMRWCDLVRTQKGWSRPALDKHEGGTYTLDDGDYRFCLPIPLKEELQYNKIEQNPGWGTF